MKRSKLILRKRQPGQSTVEFALISIVLFLLITGVLEMGYMLFAYSVVSNAAQEGSHYGIVKPRELMDGAQATVVAAQGTQIPSELIVSNGGCNVVEKARDKVWGIDRSKVDVKVWYDYGDRTPVVPTTTSQIENVIQPGNRVVVETTYKHHFFTPLFDIFAPDGIDIKMRSSRTILNVGEGSAPCTVSYTPGPVLTAIPTITVVTPTPIPGQLVISHIQAWKHSGSNQALDLELQVTDDKGIAVDGATVIAIVKYLGVPQGLPVLMPATDSTGTTRLCELGRYTGNTGAGGDVTVDVTIVKLPLLPAAGSVVVGDGRLNGCFDPPTPTRTSTPANTPTPTRTPLIWLPTLPPILPTATPTSSSTPTPIATVERLVVTSVEVWKPSGNNQPMDIKVTVTDGHGNAVKDATVIAVVTNNGLPQLPIPILPQTDASGTSKKCVVGRYDGTSGGGGGVTVAVTVIKLPFLPAAVTVASSPGRLTGCP